MKNVDITFTWRNLFFLGLFYHAVKLRGLFRQILITVLSAGHMFTRSWNALRPNSLESGNFVRNEWAKHQTYLTSQHLSEVFNQSLCQFATVAHVEAVHDQNIKDHWATSSEICKGKQVRNDCYFHFSWAKPVSSETWLVSSITFRQSLMACTVSFNFK